MNVDAWVALLARRAGALIVGFLACSGAVGCLPTPLHSIRELRANPEYFYRTYDVDASLSDMDRAFRSWSQECSPHPGLSVDPLDPTKARIVLATVLANGEPAVWALMTFVEVTPSRTKVDTFARLDVWASRRHYKRWIEDALAVARGSRDCSLHPLGMGGSSAEAVVPMPVPIR